MKISELLTSPYFSNAVIVAGKDALNREFSWCTPDIAVDAPKDPWVLPGLLVVYIGRPDDTTWKEYFSRLLEQRAAGVFLVGGDFKKFELTDEAIAFCDEHSFLVVWSPRNISVTSFMAAMYPFLLGVSVKEYSQLRWIKEVCLFGNVTSDLFITNYGYNRDYIYCPVVVRLRELRSTDVLLMESCLSSAHEIMLTEYSSDKAAVLSYMEADSLVCFLPFPPGSTKAAIKERIRATANKLKALCKGKCKCRISAGTSVHSVNEFHESFVHASKTEQLIKRLHVHQPVSFYDDWHMHLMLVDRPDAELREFMNQTLLPIIDDPVLMDTLTMYLICGENFRATAERLYIHVNTLRYRLDRVSKLLSCDFSDVTTRFRLRMAITIFRYLKGEEEERKAEEK